MKSDRSALEKNGFNPIKHPNTNILTHADVVRTLRAQHAATARGARSRLLTCLEAGDACRSLEIIGVKIAHERKGNFWADFFNFKRRIETTGWRFNALVLLINDLVVYRTWGGQPVVNELEDTRNPLGPFSRTSALQR